MRKLHFVLASATALLTIVKPSSIGAQTTFGSSNDPSATLRVDRLDSEATHVTIVRAARSPSHLAISPDVVLRDVATGIAHEVRQSESHLSKDGMLISTLLTFRAFGDEVHTFDLLDVARQQQHLYFSRIQVATPGSPIDDLTHTLGSGKR